MALCALLSAMATALPVCLSATVAFSANGDFDGETLDLPDELSQKDALLTIVYNASTYGELHPCPT